MFLIFFDYVDGTLLDQFLSLNWASERLSHVFVRLFLKKKKDGQEEESNSSRLNALLACSHYAKSAHKRLLFTFIKTYQ